MVQVKKISGDEMSGFDSSDDDNEVDPTPLEITWLDLSSYNSSESLGISALPGCKFKDTWRSLEKDIETLKSEDVSDMFVLCTRGELHKYRVPWLLRDLADADLTVHHYPVLDGHILQIETLVKMLEQIKTNLMLGKKCLVHCYGGLGRSCLVAVCLLMLYDADIEADAAIDKLKSLRGPGAVQSVKQYNFIHDFREKVEEYEKKTKDEASRSVSR